MTHNLGRQNSAPRKKPTPPNELKRSFTSLSHDISSPPLVHKRDIQKTSEETPKKDNYDKYSSPNKGNSSHEKLGSLVKDRTQKKVDDSHKSKNPSLGASSSPTRSMNKVSPQSELVEKQKNPGKESEKSHAPEKTPRPVKKQEEKGSSSKVITPTYIDEKAKRRIFSPLVKSWSVLIIAGLAVTFSYGYTVWKDGEVSKISAQSYHDGVSDSSSDASVNSIVKIPEVEIHNIVTSSPGARFPASPETKGYQLVGWSSPGGKEGRGAAEIEFCYTGEGIEGWNKASAYLVSDNAHLPLPVWNVDKTSVTGDKCE